MMLTGSISCCHSPRPFLAGRKHPFHSAIYRQQRCGRAAAGRNAHSGDKEATKQHNRGVVIMPGLGNSQNDYKALAELLTQEGLVVEIAGVNRVDWLRNAAGVVDINYWKGTLNPQPTVNWYLKRIDDAVNSVKTQTDGAPVTLLAHSAGGWLSRVYLLSKGTTGIDRLVTIGSPHFPPPQEAKVMDQTRGILTYVEQNCPGRFHSSIEYVTVAGKYIEGAGLRDQGASIAQKIVGAGYQQVCGNARVWGDGIIPIEAAHLHGADQVTLDGVYHSPLGAVVAVDGKIGRPWYGSPEVLPKWIHHISDTNESDSIVEVGDTLPPNL